MGNPEGGTERIENVRQLVGIFREETDSVGA